MLGRKPAAYPKPSLQPFGYSQTPIWCVMTKRSVGLLGWRVQNTAFAEASSTGGMRHRLPPLIPPFKRNNHDLQTLPKAIQSPLPCIHPCQGPGTPRMPCSSSRSSDDCNVFPYTRGTAESHMLPPNAPTFPLRIFFNKVSSQLLST